MLFVLITEHDFEYNSEEWLCRKIKAGQVISCISSVVGTVGIGTEIVAKNNGDLKMIYVWSAIAFIGIIGKAVFAFLNLKKDNR